MKECNHNFGTYYDFESDCQRCKSCDVCIDKSREEFNQQ